MTSIIGRVIGTKRHASSANGNPCFSIELDTAPGQWHRISADAGLSYGIQNREYANTPHVYELTRVGRLRGYARPASPAEIGAAYPHSYSLAEVRNGTGWPADVRFIVAPTDSSTDTRKA